MTSPNHPLFKEIQAFEAKKDALEEHHMGKWVVFHGGEFVNAFDTFHNAATYATKTFGKDPHLIRQVGADRLMYLPASVAYRPIHAPG